MSTNPEWFFDQPLAATRTEFGHGPTTSILNVSESRHGADAEDDLWTQLDTKVENFDAFVDDGSQVCDPHPRANEDIAIVITKLLQRSGFRNLCNVSCELDASHITLSGTVKSFHEKQVAQTIAASVGGVRSIDNQITVKP